MSQDTDIKRFAAPAPDKETDQTEELSDLDRDLDVLCERWVDWCRTRKLYAPAPVPNSVLGRLSGTARPARVGSGDAISSAELSAFHFAYISQPHGLERQVFDLYYVVRAKPIKVAAGALGISRSHFYRVLGEFRRRVFSAAEAIREASADDLRRLEETRRKRACDEPN